MASESLDHWLSRDLQKRVGRCSSHVGPAQPMALVEPSPRRFERQLATIQGMEQSLHYLKLSSKAPPPFKPRAPRQSTPMRRLGASFGLALIAMLAVLTVSQL